MRGGVGLAKGRLAKRGGGKGVCGCAEEQASSPQLPHFMLLLCTDVRFFRMNEKLIVLDHISGSGSLPDCGCVYLCVFARVRVCKCVSECVSARVCE